MTGTRPTSPPPDDETVATAAEIATLMDHLNHRLSDPAVLPTPIEVSTLVRTLGDAAAQMQEVLARIGDHLDRMSDHPDLDMPRATLAGHAVAASLARQIAQRLAGTYPGTATRRYGALLGRELHGIADAVNELQLRTSDAASST